MSLRPTPSVERVANILTVILFIAAAVLFYNSRQRESRLAPPPDAWSVGSLPLRFDRAQRTLVLALRPGCEFCTASMPFYRDLAHIRDQVPGAVTIVVVSPAPREETTTYLQSHWFRPDAVLQVAPALVSIRAVPALAIADSSGRTMYSYVGSLPVREEVRVKRILGDEP